MKCADCKFYQPTRNPETGRPLPSHPGVCGYAVEWPPLPKSFLLSGKHEMRPGWNDFCLPQRQHVWAFDSRPCDGFSPKKQPAKQPEQAKLICSEAKP